MGDSAKLFIDGSKGASNDASESSLPDVGSDASNDDSNGPSNDNSEFTSNDESNDESNDNGGWSDAKEAVDIGGRLEASPDEAVDID